MIPKHNKLPFNLESYTHLIRTEILLTMFSVSYQYTAVTQISFCQPRTQCNQREIDLPKNKRKFKKVLLRKDHFKQTFL